MKLFMALFLLGASLYGHSSDEPWLGGTRPYETVPFFEANLMGQGQFGGWQQAGAGRLEVGILDHWMLWGAWGSQPTTKLGTQVRLFESGYLPVDLGAYYEGIYGNAAWTQRAGAVIALETNEQSLCLNTGWHEGGAEAQIAYRSPFIFWTLRWGAEVYFDGGNVIPLVPQISAMLPGDLALQFGAYFQDDWNPSFFLLSLSYEIFPNP
jgi:hypothetical protein